MQTESPRHRVSDRRSCRRLSWAIGALLSFAIASFPPPVNAQVYRWVDENGVIHLSSEKPPAGVKAERLDIKTSSSSKRSSAGAGARIPGGSHQPAPKSASPEQIAGREQLLGQLKTRECVIALEALERKTGGGRPPSPAEGKPPKPTPPLKSPPAPVPPRPREEMAAKLRVANSPSCVEARNKLSDMMAPGSNAPRDQVRAQQAFVDEHCTSPIR